MTALLRQWLDFHSIYHKASHDFTIFHYCGLTLADQSYFSTLNRIYSVLRVFFKQSNYAIQGKVGVTEDSLRTNFTRFLGLANHRKQEIHPDQRYLILVLDGVDKYVNSHGCEEPALWLPLLVPFHVKLIYTCSNTSQAYKYLSSRVDTIVSVEPLTSKHITKILAQYPDFSAAIQASPVYMNRLCLYMALDFYAKSGRVIEKVQSMPELFSEVVSFSASKSKPGVVKKVLILLAVSRCGLSLEELARILRIPPPETEKILSFFDFYVFECGGLYLFKNPSIRDYVLKEVSNLQEVRLEIVEVIEKEGLTIRKIEELLYQLHKLKDWISLKSQLVDLEVFVTLMLPYYQKELLNYWKSLVDARFDPVLEYNKSLDFFISQYKLNSQQTFLVTILVSRFLKFFSEFESPQTCDFRHPPFYEETELRDIGLFPEVSVLKGLFAYEVESPLRPEENISPEYRKEGLNQVQKCGTQPTNNRHYFYKRWLWLVFPWCAEHPLSNFSQTLSAFSGHYAAYTKEVGVTLSILRFVREAVLGSRVTKQTGTRPATAQVSRPRLPRPLSSVAKKLDRTLTRPPSANHSLGQISRPLDLSLATTAQFKLDVTGSTMSEILHKISSQVHVFAKEQVQVIQNHYFKLIKQYNNLHLEKKQKTQLLADLKKQEVDPKPHLKAMETTTQIVQEQVKQLTRQQTKIENVEEENGRLLQVLRFAFKNPAKNETWQSSLELALRKMQEFIDAETGFIEKMDESVQEIEAEKKVLIQTNRAAEKCKAEACERAKLHIGFHLKLKTLIVQGTDKKKLNLHNSLSGIPKKTITTKISRSRKMTQTATTVKTFLETRLESIQKAMKSINMSSEDPSELNKVRNEILKSLDYKDQETQVLEKIKELHQVRNVLWLKLKYLRRRKVSQPVKERRVVSFEDLTVRSIDLQNDLDFYTTTNSDLQMKHIRILGQLHNLWNKLEPSQTFDSNDLPLVFHSISQRLQQLNLQ